MTNREYLATLSNEELSNTIYDVIVNRVGHRYTSSRQGVAWWLGEEFRESDFSRGLVYILNYETDTRGEKDDRT